MSYFNAYQEGYISSLREQPPEKLCWCGWFLLGECEANCPPGKTCADRLAREALNGGTK